MVITQTVIEEVAALKGVIASPMRPSPTLYGDLYDCMVIGDKVIRASCIHNA